MPALKRTASCTSVCPAPPSKTSRSVGTHTRSLPLRYLNERCATRRCVTLIRLLRAAWSSLFYKAETCLFCIPDRSRSARGTWMTVILWWMDRSLWTQGRPYLWEGSLVHFVQVCEHRGCRCRLSDSYVSYGFCHLPKDASICTFSFLTVCIYFNWKILKEKE